MSNTKRNIGLLAIALIEQVSLGERWASEVRSHSRRLTLRALLNPERVRVSLEVSKWGEGQILIEAACFLQEFWKISVPDSVDFITSKPNEDQLVAFLAIVLGRLKRPGFTPIKFFLGEDITRLAGSATVSISDDLSMVSFGCEWLSDRTLPNIEFPLGLPLMSEVGERWGHGDWRAVARQWGEADPDPWCQYYYFTAKAIATDSLSLDY